MKIIHALGKLSFKRFWAVIVFSAAGLGSASAQLAVTECMSSAATTQFRTNQVFPQSDWWELTNFGPDPIDLTDYEWSDATGDRLRLYDGLESLIIQPGESVVFFRARETPDEAAFRQWWGACLGANVRVIPWFLDIGLNESTDKIRLFDPAGILVDEVSFGEAWLGETFISDPITGDFGALSALGVCGTCQAATSDDIGSPGTTCGPIALSFLQQPVSLEVCAGMDAIFTARAAGLPRAKCQWQKADTNTVGIWTNIPGATSVKVVIADPHLADAGDYRVVVTNGLEIMVSMSATLTVSTNTSAPVILGAMPDQAVFVGENPMFLTSVCAFPAAHFQWQSNGVDILNATNRTLRIPGVTESASGTVLRVNIWNELGATNQSARLRVMPEPQVEITEAMPAPSLLHVPSMSHVNWWELTNRGTNVLEFYGFLHSDGTSNSAAMRVTNTVVLRPGESLIMLDGMTPEEFVHWWGVTNLPGHLQIIRYGGYGLNPWTDYLSVWSATADETSERLAGIDYACWPSFPSVPPMFRSQCGPEARLPIYGRSLFFIAKDTCANHGMASVEGREGAFRAAEGDDVGSPGWTRWTPPSLTSISRDAAGVVLSWKAPPGSTNEVQYKQSLSDPVWTPFGSVAAAGATRTFTNSSLGLGITRLYRIVCPENGLVSQVVMWPPPPPRFVNMLTPPGPPGPTLTWTTEPVHTYVLQYRSNVANGAWTSIHTNVATNGFLKFTDTNLNGSSQRFYRVICPPLSQ